ncbi:hypothetical protein Bca4012_008580 [Brassica carinata]
MKPNSMPDPVSARQSNVNPEEIRTTLLSRATSLSETALKVLLWRRDKLTHEQRSIEDKIAKCDERIKNIKGDVELQLETILESCNEAYPRRIFQESNEMSACQSNKRQKLCECPPFRLLPKACVRNSMISVSRIAGYYQAIMYLYQMVSFCGFVAEVRIKETQFAHSICGEEKSDAEEAKESAAACLLTKLHQNTTIANDHVLTEDHLRSPSSAKDLTAYLFLALRTLRSDLVKEYPGGVMASQIFTNPMLQKISKKILRNKEELLEIDGIGEDIVSKYGDRLLETIESTIKEFSLNQEERLHGAKYGHGEA